MREISGNVLLADVCCALACRLDKEMQAVIELAARMKELDVRISTTPAYVSKVSHCFLHKLITELDFLQAPIYVGGKKLMLFVWLGR